MKRLPVVIALISMIGSSTLAWAQLPHFSTGDVLHASDLNAVVNRINALGGPSGQPQTISVDCTTGGTIGQALDQTNPGDIIQITAGPCNETVRIIKDGITLAGQGLGTTIIDGGGSAQATIIVDGVQRVTIQGLTAQNGDRGIVIGRGAAAILVDVTATGNATDGILVVDNATARFQGAIMSHDNGNPTQGVGNGILIIRSGNAVFDGATVQLKGNGDRGLTLTGTAAGELRNSSLAVTNNHTDGIGVFNGSSLLLRDATAPISVSSNDARGVHVSLNATLQLRNSTMTVTGTNTSNDGIGVFDSSSFFIRDATAPIAVSSNGARGVSVANTSSLIVQSSQLNTTSNTGDGVGVFGSSRLTLERSSTTGSTGSTLVSENNANGVNAADASSVQTINGSTLTVQNNSSSGLQLSRSSSANLTGTTTSASNGVYGINLQDTSSASMSGTTLIQGNTSFGIRVVRASELAGQGTLNILSNGDDGIRLDEGSALRLFDGTMVIHSNTNAGINVFRNSVALLALAVATLDLQISNNTLQGIQVLENSSVRVETGTAIMNNGTDGILARRSSEIAALGVNITGNGSHGLNIDESSAEVSNNSTTNSTITGNTGGDINATFGSRLTLNNSTVGTVTCDSTVARRGNTPRSTCP